MPENPIYDFLKANKLTDKDEATFLKEYSDSSKAKELYGFFQANNLTDKDFNGFYDTYLKKKQDSQIGGKVGSSVGRLDVGAGITEIDDKGKPVGGALSRVSGITTPEQAKISRVNKAFGKIESFAGSREDFEEIYKQAPQEFDNLAKQVAPNVNKGEIDKFYTTEAARKDAYVDRVLQSYNQQKTKAILEWARKERPVKDFLLEGTLNNNLSSFTGKQYQLPQSEAQVSEILSDLNNEKEKLKTELTTNWNLSEVQTKAKELSEIEAAIRQNLTYQVGRMALERLSQNNPNVTSKDIGKEIFRVLHPDEYDLYEKVGGDKPVSFTVGTQGDTPVEADALNEQMVQLGNEIKRMYGNETAIQDADIEEQTAKRKYTFQRQAQVKQKIAAILHERGLSPDKATEELKDKVVNKYLPDEDKEIWYNNNKAYNNTKLPSTGLGYSFKNDFNSFVKDAVSSTFGVLLPNRQKARAAQVLAESSESKLLGEDPQYKARLGQLKAKEEQIGLSDKEKEEKESLETYTNIRSKWEKRFDLAGTGLGTIMAMGTVSAFTGGLLNARNIPTAIKSLIAPSQASMRGRLATSVLTFYESNARNALKEYPNDKDWFKRGLKAGLDTAVDSLTEMLFPEEKILSGIGKREVAKMVSNLTAKNLNATLNSNVFKDIARAMIGGSKRLVAVPLQEGAEELIAATLKEAYDGAINPDPDRQALDIKQMIEIGENTLWSSGLLGVPKALFGGKSNKVPLNALWDSVSTQDGYITQKMTIERLKRDGELTEAEAKDRLDNLELGRNEYLNNPILSGDMGGLDAGQKQNYFARILNEAILKKQADAVTDPNLKKQYEQQIKESEAIREKIYKGDIKVTPENEELTKKEFEKQEAEKTIIDQDRVLGDEEVVVSQSDEELLTTLQELAQEGVKDQDLQFFVDQAANAPNQFIETYGEQVTQELLDKATTEQIQKGLEDARKFENNPNVSLLEKELERRGTTIADFVAPQAEAGSGGVVVGEEMRGYKFPDENEIYDIIESEEGRHGGEFIGEDGKFQTEDDARRYVKEVSDHLGGIAAQENIPIYRVVQADEVDLTPYGIGESWTFDLDAAKEFAKMNLSGSPKDWKIISAIVPKENVDWEQAVRQYTNFSDIMSAESEFELPIEPNSKLLNVSVSDYKKAKSIEQPKAETPTQETTPVSEPITPPTTQAKELADKVRKLKIDLGKLSGGGLQSNPLGLPVAVWNGAMDIIAKTIETGGNIADAIKRGLNYIQKNHRGQWNKKQFNDEVMKELGVRGITVNGEDLVVKDVDKEFAETINGFYSDLEQTILEVSPTDKGTPQAWLKKIGTGDEAKWTGVTDWLNSLPKDQKLTRKEILDWLKDNRIQVVEVVKGNTKEKIDLSKVEFEDVEEGSELYGDFDYVSKDGNYRVAKYRDGSMILFDNNDVSISKIDTLTDIVDFENEANNTKFSQYQLEGQKENYKEVLVTLPQVKTGKKIYQVINPDGTVDGYGTEDLSVAKSRAERKGGSVKEKFEPAFHSTHFDEPNILVHLRMNTRTDADGNKVLFLEEIQSDWGQKGKKEGFSGDYDIRLDPKYDMYVAYDKNGNKIPLWYKGESVQALDSKDKVIEALKESPSSAKTPQAPFVTETPSWTKLGLKVALKEAVKQGADKIAWTTGEQQNERYDLSKQVDELFYQKLSNGKYQVDADKDGKTVFTREFTEQELPNFVGKEVAEKIVKNEGKLLYNAPTYSGESIPKYSLKEKDLQIGGKGMKGFYGSPSEGKLGIVGEVAKSLFKQEPKTVGIDLGMKGIEAGTGRSLGNQYIVRTESGNRIAFDDLSKAKKYVEENGGNLEKHKNISQQQAIIITPELKQEAETGLPLFKDIKGRGKEIADLLRKGKIKMGGLQSNIAGIPIAIYNAAIETIALALEGGATLTQAIQKAINKHKLNQQKGFNQKEFISKLEDATGEKFTDDQQQSPPPQTPKQEPKEVGIKHKETEAIRQRYGLPEYERAEGKTNAELEAEANRLISEGYDIEKLIKKIEDGTPPTGVENYILTKYIGNLEAKFAKDKSDKTLKELKRLLDATDRIGSLQSEAFRTRKAMSPADDSLASFFIKEMDSLGVDELTQEQKATITKEYEEIKATNDALQKKIVELEKQMAEMESKQKVSDEAKRIVRGRKTKQQFNEERKKIIGNIREKLRKAKGETQATVVPYLKELIVIAPDVAKLVKNLVEEGVTNLADIVDNIHEYLKDEIDGIQKKDVVDLIAGVYNEKKPTRNELAKKLFDLKAEAKLLNRYAELVEGKEPASEKKKIQRNKELSDLRKKIKESDITKLSQVKEKYKTQIAELEQKIKDGDFSKPEPKKKIKLDKEGQQLRDKLIKLKQQRDARILLNQRVNETKKQRGLRLFAEVLNIPRTLMTIGDFSGLLRQGIFGISHPSMMANASKQMFKTAFSQKEYDRWFADLKEDPRFYAMKESKLSIADSLSHDLSEREEVFMSTLAEKIPIVGQTLTIKGKKVIPGLNIVKGSERSYTALLNKMRVDLFNYFADSMEARGLTIENAPKQYKAMAEYINNATGRSDFGKHLNRIAPILNSVFFSPRLIASRVNMLTYFMQPRFWKTLPKEARIDYFRSWASLLSIGLTILALAQAGGADVEDDPRSSDFGKIRSGDTRWDIWGGAQPYMRVFAQVVSGKRKSTNSGEIYELTGDDAFGETRAGVVSDFFRGKLAPVPASMVDVLSGRTTTGDKIVYEFETDGVKEVAIDNYIMERLLPMTITGTREAIKERGASAILTVGVPSVFGVGTQTYGKPIKEVRDEVEYEGVKIKLTKEQYLKYRDLANKYINENVNKLKSLKEYQQIEDRDERLGIERAVKNYSVSKAEQEIIDLYEKTFKDTEELKDKAKEKKEKREDILEQIKD